MRPRVVSLAQALLWPCLAMPAVAQAPPRPGVRAAECIASADARVPGWVAEGLPASEVVRRQKLAAASCMGKDTGSATAVYVGAINVDLKRLGSMFMAGQLTGAEHLARMRDRGRKLRLARANPGWAADWVRGDKDGDLVPDKADKCPGTPPLAPTSDNGCAAATPPPMSHGDDELVRALAGDMGVVGTRQCDGATIPDTPTPLLIRRSEAPMAVITLVPAANQPAGCLVLYELLAVTRAPGEDGVGADQYHHVVLKDFEGTTPAPGELRFVLHNWDPGGRGALASAVQAGHATEWQVRAFNGMGLASPWSGWYVGQ